MSAGSRETIIKVRNLKKYFPFKKKWFSTPVFLKAVDDISFEILQGETLALVGESGCGKTTVGKSILRLLEPTSGDVCYKDTDITGLSYQRLVRLRREMQIIFQDPADSLNPRKTVAQMLSEPLKYHRMVKREEVYQK